MNIIDLNNHIGEILDRYDLGTVKRFNATRLYGSSSETPVYNELLKYFSDKYKDILGIVRKNYSNLQPVEISEFIDMEIQIKLSLVMLRTPLLQFPPLKIHEDKLQTIEDENGPYTSIVQIADSFIMAFAGYRPLLDQGRVLILPRGFGWRLPLKDKNSLLNTIKYAEESIQRFPEGGLGAILDSFDQPGGVYSRILNPDISGYINSVSFEMWQDFVTSLSSKKTVLGNVDIGFPILDGINAIELNKLIEDEKDIFLNLSKAFLGIFNEIKEKFKKGQNVDKLVNEITRDTINSELMKIERVYRNYIRHHAIKIGAIMLATIPLIISGLLVPNTTELLLKTIGSSGILTLLGKEYADYLKNISALKDSEWYFIWKHKKK